MCLIIQREPNFEIPYEKFKTAILNNPDGYGLTFPDSKGLTVFRTPDEPDPEKLYRFINEELADKKIMLHLRYTTVGETTLRNAHPFPILERKTDGVDLRMAHNGTLSKYRPARTSSESDTRTFVKEYVRPLFKRLVKGMEPEELLTDPFLKKILEDQLTNSSVLTFLDDQGNSLICNETGNGGKLEDKWYYSNTYSFNEYHRTSSTPSANNYLPPDGYSSTKKFADCKTEKFTKRYKMRSIYDTFDFSDDLIATIADSKEDAELLIKELIAELQLSKSKEAKNVN
jgi:predicted glutamine amidotransferase